MLCCVVLCYVMLCYVMLYVSWLHLWHHVKEPFEPTSSLLYFRMVMNFPRTVPLYVSHCTVQLVFKSTQF